MARRRVVLLQLCVCIAFVAAARCEIAGTSGSLAGAPAAALGASKSSEGTFSAFTPGVRKLQQQAAAPSPRDSRGANVRGRGASGAPPPKGATSSRPGGGGEPLTLSGQALIEGALRPLAGALGDVVVVSPGRSGGGGAANGARGAPGGAGPGGTRNGGGGGDLLSGFLPFVLQRDARNGGGGGGSDLFTGLLSLVNPATYRLLPVRPASSRRRNCVVYTPGYSDNLRQVSERIGVPLSQLLSDNVGALSSTTAPLEGRVVLVCGLAQGAQVAPPKAGGGARDGKGAAPPKPAAAAKPTAAAAAAAAAATAAVVAAPREEAVPDKPVLQGNVLATSPEAQQAALLSIKAALDPNGKMLPIWTPAAGPYCEWVNVVCDEAGNVLRLTLSYLNLDGSLPAAKVLQGLPRLEALLLGGNALRGTLPAGYSTTGLQEIYLNENMLSGSLPAGWASNKQLTELSLGFNMLTGTLPAAWAALPRLTALKLNSNRFNGTVPKAWAPPGGLPALETITIFDNAQLGGCLPRGLEAGGREGRGLFQAMSGQHTRDAAAAASGTEVTGFC